MNVVSEEDIARSVQLATAGYSAGLLHVDSEKEDVPLRVRLDRASRSDVDRLQNCKWRAAPAVSWRLANW